MPGPTARSRTKTKLPVSTKALRREPGTLIAGFFVEGRPVPWSAPTTTRTGHAFKNPHLVTWQQVIQIRAQQAMGGFPPYVHPVYISLHFYLKRRSGRPPDTSNLAKGCEDALQGSVIFNDSQVGVIHSKRQFITEGEGVHIEVMSWEDD